MSWDEGVTWQDVAWMSRVRRKLQFVGIDQESGEQGQGWILLAVGESFAVFTFYPGCAFCDVFGLASKAVVASPAVTEMQSVTAQADPVDTQFWIG